MKLSVVVPGIRKNLWKSLYDSIAKSFSGEFELIIIGPYEPDFKEDNLVWIKDFGAPARCAQRGLLAAKGELISFAWDDGTYIDNSLNECFALLPNDDYHNIIIGKFYEVVHDVSAQKSVAEYQAKDDLYYIKTHTQAFSNLFNPDFKIFSTGIATKKMLMEVGGFNCNYELFGIALLDISVRLQLHGCNMILKPEPIFTCQWSFGEDGHNIVQEAYEKADQALYQKTYRSDIKPTIVVDPNNWEKSPMFWERRFAKTDISVIMPTIRVGLLRGVYESIKESYHGAWELVLVGPTPPPQDLLAEKNVTWIQSFMSPIGCRQLALLASKGKWICYAADDVTFIKGALDEAYETVKKNNFYYKFIVSGKYLENTSAANPDNIGMRNDIYYHLNHHDALKPAMANFPDWLIVNTGLVSRELLMEVGGWDCDFEVCSIACCDISMRLQNYGAVVHLQNNPIFHSTWYTGTTGDHGPIHDAHTYHDLPLFTSIWENPDFKDRKVVDINKWKSLPHRWERRFK